VVRNAVLAIQALHPRDGAVVDRRSCDSTTAIYCHPRTHELAKKTTRTSIESISPVPARKCLVESAACLVVNDALVHFTGWRCLVSVVKYLVMTCSAKLAYISPTRFLQRSYINLAKGFVWRLCGIELAVMFMAAVASILTLRQRGMATSTLSWH
jgi:hypothetical protein